MAVVLLAAVAACGSSDDGAAPPSPPILVLSAFPAELAPLVERADVVETIEVEGRVFRIGSLAGMRVVLGLTGIGLMNATATTRAALERFEVAGVVVSAVAGSPLRIADVTVPGAWRLPDGRVYPVDRSWLALAREIANGSVPLERCTIPPSLPDEGLVCLAEEPVIFVGGYGSSSDPFGDTPFPCDPDGDDVFGCDVPPSGAAPARGLHARSPLVELDLREPIAEDMETAAIAQQAAAHGLPFLAFRAASDGAGDPLDLPGFPSQFFAYYRLAAHNAAAATIAFLERVGNLPKEEN